MRRTAILSASVLALALPLLPTAPLAADPIDPSLFAGLKARSIGPAAMSGRVSDVVGVESNPDVLYVGSANGGVWKTVNGGLTWDPVFDSQKVASVGAIAVFQANPDVVWVGTGEDNPRNSVSVGWGVYRSLDGGRTWKHLGLEKTERISRIILHPTNPDVAWVAALGQLWGENADRGVFKTTDGGRTWRKVLYVDERTGAADLAMDPANPNKLFAALWEHRRRPWVFRSGGPGSGLHVTDDGGETWKRLTEDDGLPSGDLGRIGLAISRSNPEIVYALVEATKSALVRSEDGGRTWKTANDDPRTSNRPFYYSEIRVDPAWPNRVYNIATRLSVSNDSGKSFDEIDTKTHGDFHTMWIDPRDPSHLIAGDDGGLAITRDRGRTWYFPPNLPLGQYYHVNVDMEVPYNLYGGLQDNGTWRGPSEVQDDEGGIRNQHWMRIGGGDGFDAAPDPQDSQIGYSMSQGGALLRWNLHTGEIKEIQPPEPKPGDGHEPLRFNWSSGLALDPFEPGTLYYGSQYVHKSTDRGDTWTIASPDLTTDNSDWQKQSESGGLTPDVTAAESYTTILAIAPSPIERGVIWVGTDDGRVHVTRDGGKTWTSVEKNIPGVPANTWVPHIRPSRFDAASAFLVMDNHRREDWAPYVFRTDDWGKTWKSLATRDVDGWALSIEQDPVDRDLLFLGTEFGLYVSTDGGRRWMRWKHGLPTTAVADLAIHPRENDLVIATHGRGLYIVDDITPLRHLTPEVLREPLHLYPSTAGRLDRREIGNGNTRAGAGDFHGENRPYGVELTYSLNLPGLPLPEEEAERARKEEERAAARATAAKGPAKPGETLKEDPEATADTGAKGKDKDKGPRVEIRIEDASGKLVRKMDGPAQLGFNRATWDLGRDAFVAPPTDSRGRQREPRSGPKVPPGTYRVKVKYKDHVAEGTAQVVPSPLTKNTAGDWQAREAAFERIRTVQDSLGAATDRIAAARADLDLVQKKLDAADKARKDKSEEGEDPNRDLKKAAKGLRAKLDAAEKTLFVPPGTKGIVDDSGTAFTQIQDAGRSLESSWDPPNATQLSQLDRAEATAKTALAGVDRVWAEDVPAFRKLVEGAKIELLGPTP
ncbi:MAG TPA: hypothetical protein VEW48_23815 [Thermoanaerobaculia bacterium]|nr:hypothetical protein [Thermoanaerobaculia bacterium]